MERKAHCLKCLSSLQIINIIQNSSNIRPKIVPKIMKTFFVFIVRMVQKRRFACLNVNAQNVKKYHLLFRQKRTNCDATRCSAGVPFEIYPQKASNFQEICKDIQAFGCTAVLPILSARFFLSFSCFAVVFGAALMVM